MQFRMMWSIPFILVIVIALKDLMPLVPGGPFQDQPAPAGFAPPRLAWAEFTPDAKLILAQFYQLSISGHGDNLHHAFVYDAVSGKKLADMSNLEARSELLRLHPDGRGLL